MQLIIGTKEDLSVIDAKCLKELKKNTPLVVGNSFSKVLSNRATFGYLVPSNEGMRDLLQRIVGDDVMNNILTVEDQNVSLWT